MIEATGWFLLGLVLLALGGDSVVKGASGLARHYRLSPFATGLLLVAFATSIPELAVNARAMWVGSQALALGNAVGSNIVNFGLTLGAAALAAPLVVRWRVLAPLLVCFVVLGVAVIGLGHDGVLGVIDGALLLFAFAAVLGFALARSRTEDPQVLAALEEFSATRSDLALNLVRLAIAAAVLYYGARLVVQAAPMLGAGLGMAPLVAGLLPVAIGTALPEVAAAIVAARRGQGDLVLGHVIGSSLCNLTLVLGGMAVFRPVPLPHAFVWFELPAALAFALVLYPMLRGDLRIARGEGAILVLAFLGWAGYEVFSLAR